ncbi:unnamed protein product, partial [Musa acuminata subsp. malaccensis]|uniref:(wild Malaysian banana) hypothetical protein n=1 Tax=Musa acuminata subsp. malaccensis TaxID=214687 RepID=A0A804HWD4_MUSAM
ASRQILIFLTAIVFVDLPTVGGLKRTKGGCKENEGNACALTTIAIATATAICSCPTHKASCFKPFFASIQDWYPC